MARAPAPGVLSPREKTATGETPHSQFRNLLGTNKKYTVSLSSQGRSHLAWCGASHGWLIASEEKLPRCSNLLLYNPFTFAAIPLPPITDLGGAITTVYHDDAVNIIGYHYEEYDELLARLPLKFTSKFFDKVVLSCDPSRGGADCIAMAIYGLNQVSFARPGDSSWRLAPIAQMGTDTYADCIYHNGRFYAVTMDGTVETWDLGMGPAQDPKKHVLIDTEPGIKKYMGIHARFLVSTPWGALLQIRVLLHNRIKFRNKRMKVEVLQVDVEKHKLVKLSPSTAFREHAVFVGLNESACLHPVSHNLDSQDSWSRTVRPARRVAELVVSCMCTCEVVI
jgi:hypothetical protein